MKLLREALFFGGVAFILAGPIYVQILGGPLTPTTRSWRMYALSGLKTCEVRYERHHPDGRVEPLDRLALLDAGQPERYRRYRLGDPGDIRHQGRNLCRALDKGRTDIRIHARCPTKQGWEPLFDGTENICR